jgi:hypothetical protein
MNLAMKEEPGQMKQKSGQGWCEMNLAMKEEPGQIKQKSGQGWGEMNLAILKEEPGQAKQESGQGWGEMNQATQDSVLADEATGGKYATGVVDTGGAP